MTYEEIINKYNGLIWEIVHRYKNSIDIYDQDDIYQECLMKIFEVYEKYNGEYKMSTFLSIVLKNYLRDLVKESSRQYNTNYINGVETLDIKNYNFEFLESDIKRYNNKEKKALEFGMILLNDNKHKDIINRVLYGETYKAIAKDYNCSYQNIQQIFYKYIKDVESVL